MKCPTDMEYEEYHKAREYYKSFLSGPYFEVDHLITQYFWTMEDRPNYMTLNDFKDFINDNGEGFGVKYCYYKESWVYRLLFVNKEIR